MASSQGSVVALPGLFATTTLPRPRYQLDAVVNEERDEKPWREHERAFWPSFMALVAITSESTGCGQTVQHIATLTSRLGCLLRYDLASHFDKWTALDYLSLFWRNHGDYSKLLKKREAGSLDFRRTFFYETAKVNLQVRLSRDDDYRWQRISANHCMLHP